MTFQEFLLEKVEDKKYDKQIIKGIKVEMEHLDTFKKIEEYVEEHKKFPPNKLMAKWIAVDHLKESEIYYDLLEEMEKKID